MSLLNLVGLGHCYFDKSTGATICPHVSSVCPKAGAGVVQPAGCTVFNPCANANASSTDSACKKKSGGGGSAPAPAPAPGGGPGGPPPPPGGGPGGPGGPPPPPGIMLLIL